MAISIIVKFCSNFGLKIQMIHFWWFPNAVFFNRRSFLCWLMLLQQGKDKSSRKRLLMSKKLFPSTKLTKLWRGRIWQGLISLFLFLCFSKALKKERDLWCLSNVLFCYLLFMVLTTRASLFSPIVTSLQIIDDGSASISCYTVCYTLKNQSNVVDLFLLVINSGLTSWMIT